MFRKHDSMTCPLKSREIMSETHAGQSAFDRHEGMNEQYNAGHNTVARIGLAQCHNDQAQQSGPHKPIDLMSKTEGSTRYVCIQHDTGVVEARPTEGRTLLHRAHANSFDATLMAPTTAGARRIRQLGDDVIGGRR